MGDDGNSDGSNNDSWGSGSDSDVAADEGSGDSNSNDFMATFTANLETEGAAGDASEPAAPEADLPADPAADSTNNS